VVVTKDAGTGWDIYELRQGNTQAGVVPAAGCNAFSVRVYGVEYLRQPERLARLPGVGYGTPVLYPTPNRVRGAQFTWDGKTYSFPANNGDNFILGLVHSADWRVVQREGTPQQALLTCQLAFQEQTDAYSKFPFQHTLSLTIAVTEGAVRWTYEVDNRGDRPVPFGFALHPYFLYQGSRRDAYLTVPATHVMESVERLPTGKLLSLDENRFDARTGVCLEGFVVDDVYYGMTESKPVLIDFRDVRRRVTLRASNDFTHLVVYTPEQPFLCVENQTCSTDAHNLHNQGQRDVAHLQVCQPGETMGGWVEYRFEQY
jgi:aldose 1-epimerase